jgi:hypothetical protein
VLRAVQFRFTLYSSVTADRVMDILSIEVFATPDLIHVRGSEHLQNHALKPAFGGTPLGIKLHRASIPFPVGRGIALPRGGPAPDQGRHPATPSNRKRSRAVCAGFMIAILYQSGVFVAMSPRIKAKPAHGEHYSL